MEEKDLLLRKEFAKAFGWYKPKNGYFTTDEPQSPSWEEIFVKVVMLLQSQASNNRDEILQGLLDRVLVLENKLLNKHP